jgi:hypothetical protein
MDSPFRSKLLSTPDPSAVFPPVSTASSTMAVPASSSTSAGTTCSAWLSPAAPQIERLPLAVSWSHARHCACNVACMCCELEDGEAGFRRTVRPADGDDVPGQQRVTWQLVPLPLAVHLCAAIMA